MAPSGKAQVDAHLKKISPKQREVLEALRKQLVVELPTAEQVIKYGIPTFIIEGVPVIGFDAYKNHNSIFPYSGSFSARLKADLAKYEQTKGSIHFNAEKFIPKALVKKIVKAKIEQINDSYPKKSGEFLEFYSNGVLKAQGKMKAGKQHGDWKWFSKTGEMTRSCKFKDGVIISGK